MGKIDIKAATSLMQRKNMALDNTQVIVDEKGDAKMYLFGNHIATYTHNNRLFVTNSGWNTRSTRSRLSHIPNVQASTSKKQPFINGIKWSGKWTELIIASPILIMSELKHNP